MILKRIIHPITRGFTVNIEVETDEEGKVALSMTSSGYGHAGQCPEVLLSPGVSPRSGFSRDDLQKIHDIWQRWHLNAMRPGTPKQMEYLRNLPQSYWDAHSKVITYGAKCAALKAAGLLYDGRYLYGSDWLYEEVPKEVLEYLFTLPGEGATLNDLRSEPDWTPVDRASFLELITV